MRLYRRRSYGPARVDEFLANLGRGCGERQKLRQLGETPPGLADRVRTLRESLGLKQHHLARRVGCVQTTIAAVERGKMVGPRILTGLARALGTTIEFLLGTNASTETAHHAQHEHSDGGPGGTDGDRASAG